MMSSNNNRYNVQQQPQQLQQRQGTYQYPLHSTSQAPPSHDPNYISSSSSFVRQPTMENIRQTRVSQQPGISGTGGV